MDVNTLLDFVEELLNMYGYETRRNVGIKGHEIHTTPLERETGTLDEHKKMPVKHEPGIAYKVDILAEKKDIERPFGRLIVRYKRGQGPVTRQDVEHLGHIKEYADAHSAILLTTTGFDHEAEHASHFMHVTLMTPEKIQSLLGKAMVKDKWWFNAPAYPVKWDYEKVKWKLKWFFEKIMMINFDCIWFWNKELAYEPHWKFSYHIAPKVKSEGMKEGYFSINAHTGEIDTWIDQVPEVAAGGDSGTTLKDAWFGREAVHTVEAIHMVSRTKIKKPKLPKGVNFVVFKPSMEKHEAKLAAIQWISYVENVLPEDVVITSRELVYYPWWKFFYFYRPIVKNSWQDTEYFGIKMSGVYGDIFNQYRAYSMKRDVIYYYMEKSLIKMLGRDRYVKMMRKVTLGISVLWWNYHLVIKPNYIWAFLLLLTGGTIYAFITASFGLSIVLGILLALIFMGPGYAFLYILQDYLKRYPVASYQHPVLTKKKYEKLTKPVVEANIAFAQLEKLEIEDKLNSKEKKALEKIRNKRTKGLVKKVKKAN
ncbi:MAG: restriction endonuclease [archaeon]